jgi:hypothetical protein
VISLIIWIADKPVAQGASLLSADQINSLMGTKNLVLIDRYDDFEDLYTTTTTDPPVCEEIGAGVPVSEYEKAGRTHLDGEILFATGSARQESVIQALSTVNSEIAGRQLLEGALRTWRPCDGKKYSSMQSETTATIAEATKTGITARYEISRGGRVAHCELTAAIRGDQVAEVLACGDDVADKSKVIVRQILQTSEREPAP